MLVSKALKEYPKKSLINRIIHATDEFKYGDKWYHDVYYEIHEFVFNFLYYKPKGFFQNCRRAVDYIGLAWDNYDWEGHYLYRVMQFKLKRIEKSLENGHAIPNQHNELKALKLAIKLGDRLWKDDYRQFLDAHDKKWGELTTWFEDTGKGDDTAYWKSKRPNANTEEEKKQEREEFKEAIRKDDRREAKERELYFKILAKYLPYMWD